MTSFIIDNHLDRSIHDSWKLDGACTFCRITSGELPAFKLYEDDKVIAILDILPLRRGHALVIPKTHYSRISELPEEFAAATGIAVTKVGNALTKALGNSGLNIVCNQEYAQAVPHVHFHIIPAPTFGDVFTSTPQSSESVPSEVEMHRLERASREELDEEDAAALVNDIRARL